MSAKRKSNPAKRATAPKRNKKKQDEDFESDFSDSNDGLTSGGGGGGGGSGNGAFEVLIPNEYEPAAKLPEELLKSFDREPGHLAIAGCVTWDLTGRRDTKQKVLKVRPGLFNFHRFMDEQKFRAAVSGPCSAHSVLITMDRKALTFGRNQFGQLGQPNLETYELPTAVPELEGLNIIRAACGRNHTLFLTDTGTVYACGDNKAGQCGIGSSSVPLVQKATRINYQGPPIIKVGCGAEFSAILDIKGNLYTFGHPEYGQLGHNTDGKYFQTSTKISYHFEYSPKKVVLFIDKAKDGHVTPMDGVQVVDFSCANNHTVAIDSQKRAYSWGFGGFGRLGHAEPRDEMVPRLIKLFESQGRGVRSVYCGASFSVAVNDLGVVMLWGQNKKTGEANMYPKPVHDLSGWNVTDIGVSNTSIMISADDSLIAWGASPTYGELGLGDLLKSSSVPKEVSRCEGMKIPQVSMGYSHTMLICNTDHALTKEKYEKMPKFTVED